MPARIACLTFSRAGRLELVDRLAGEPGVYPGDLIWLRTIHAAALRLERERGSPRIMGRREWRAFAAQFNYRFSKLEEDIGPDEEPELATPPRVTADDALRHAYDWGRNRRLRVQRILARYRGAPLRPDQFELYVQRLEGFKRERGLVDFLDLLEHALEHGGGPEVDAYLIDEAQELSPLQLAVLARWTRGCALVTLAADDDQSIHGFQGGDPGWLIDLRTRCQVTRLTQSYRVPVQPHALAQVIISQNRARVPKQYLPKPMPGVLLRLPLARTYPLLDGSRRTFVLARNRRHLRPVAKELIERATPFVVEGGGAPSPLADSKLVAAARTTIELHARKEVRFSAASIAILLEFVSMGLATKPARAAIHGASRAGRVLTVYELAGEFGLSLLLQVIYTEGPLGSYLRAGRSTRRYLSRLHQKFGEFPKPLITLTSIHGSKGREAPLVVLLSEMSPRSFEQYRGDGREEENRIYYVGVTRTTDTLVLVDPRSRRHFDFPRLGAAGSPACGDAGEAMQDG